MASIRWFLSHIRGKRGTVLALYGIALTAMLGLAAISIDAGYVYTQRQKLLNSLDAASLAGIASLPDNPAGAEQAARDILAANGLDPAISEISVSADSMEMSVALSTYSDLFFARALGFSNLSISADVTARVEWITGVQGAVPFGVPQQDFQLGADYILKASGGGGQNGNYHALALGGTGANNYRQNIAGGYQTKIRIGDWLKTETGNMAGPTEQGLGDRIGNAAKAGDADGNGYLDLPPNSPRILLCPIIDFFDANGRSQVQVVGFGAFYVEDWGGSGHGEVSGKFVRYITQGESGGSGNFGLRTVRLVH